MPKLLTLSLLTLLSTTTPAAPHAADECVRGGCNGELCQEASQSQPVSHGCDVTAKSGCYQYGQCGRDKSGACAWLPNPTFDICMKNAGNSVTFAEVTPTVTHITPTLNYYVVGPMEQPK